MVWIKSHLTLYNQTVLMVLNEMSECFEVLFTRVNYRFLRDFIRKNSCKMQIRLIPREDGVAEWALIELQGTLESAGTLTGQRIGSLKWEKKKALLHIGHHIMEGKEVKLQHPLIVLTRDAENREIVHISAVIRKKVQFRARPMPV
ncbi:unnamed protein product [Litomosoides sigmodontis]|uniref:Uncharacterized protein n=1 Tax=Litomosoides sigmodontis TaxID=42156 RepID=A0A3P6T4I5_LITSI|nr:unnamed protein product [Litomosoides sigmodontis]